MRLSDLVRTEWISTDLDASDRDGALHWIATRLAEVGTVPNAIDVRDALIARETSHTTAMGHGMAIPHTTVPGLAEPVLMVATAPEPVSFAEAGANPADPDDDGTVRLFFVLLSPPGHESHHIKTLARICRLARYPEFVDGILSAESAAGVHDVIVRIDGEHV